MRKEELKYQLFSGLGNALTTIAYAALLYLFDPSVTLPFSYVVIMYLLGIEMISEKNSPTFAELQSSIIITFGAIMASLSLGGINPRELLIVFLVQNPTSALFSIYQRKLKSLRIDGSPNDSINIRFWNLIFTAIFATVIALLLKPSSNLIPIIHENLPMLSLTALITSFSLILYIRALGMAKASVAQAFRATSLIFAMPIALSQFYGDPLFALIKSMGIVLVALGVTSFALTEVRAFLLVKVGRGISFKRVMERIWEIQGVDSVAMVAGEYDIIVKVRTRTLGKGYERIIGEIEKIEGIEDFKWNSILKEWEEI
jgi:DNA-binding Lrp family transcriptional regulator